MHFAVVCEGTPTLDTNGGQQTSWMIIKSLVDAGHKVTACLLLDCSSPWHDERTDTRLAVLRSMEVTVVPVKVGAPPPAIDSWPKRLRRLCSPRLEEYFPIARLSAVVTEILRRAQPDGVFAFDVPGAAATNGLVQIPCMAGLGALPHTMQGIWWRQNDWHLTHAYFRNSLGALVRYYWLKRLLPDLVASCQEIRNFGPDIAAELNSSGLRCSHIRPPAYDFGGPDWQERRLAQADDSKFRILLIGHTQGTFSRYGLHLFADEVLPILEKEVSSESIEVRIVGAFAPSPDLAEKLESPLVKICGWVESIEAEFFSAHVVLVPNPIALGLRMRIITGLSFGSCTVAHEANLVGSPELVSEESILVGRNGPELASAVLRAMSDATLRQAIGNKGREVFDNYFAQSVAGARIVRELEEMAIRHRDLRG